ncbi:hypothetical protein GCM10025768_04110 [Microbacterium pseudoresistens]
MSIGRYVSDLEVGDELRSVTYEMTPFIVREYCHGIDEHAEEFHRAIEPFGAQLVPPPMTHIDKIRLIKENCPDGPGPNARIHYQFHSTHHKPIPVGATLVASGVIARKYEKKGRTYLEMDIEVRESDSGELVMSYNDTAILNYTPSSA